MHPETVLIKMLQTIVYERARWEEIRIDITGVGELELLVFTFSRGIFNFVVFLFKICCESRIYLDPRGEVIVLRRKIV